MVTAVGDLDTTVTLAGQRASLEESPRRDPQGELQGSREPSGDQRSEETVAVDHLDPKRFARGVESGDLRLRASAEGSGSALDRQRSHALVRLEGSRLGEPTSREGAPTCESRPAPPDSRARD